MKGLQYANVQRSSLYQTTNVSDQKSEKIVDESVTLVLTFHAALNCVREILKKVSCFEI